MTPELTPKGDCPERAGMGWEKCKHGRSRLCIGLAARGSMTPSKNSETFSVTGAYAV